jgi:hypothetical protein
MPPEDQRGRPQPPPQEYRPVRDYDSGADASMRTIAIAAVAIAVVVMGGVWALSGRHHAATVPVIAPDSRPLRIKPTNPGGMQVPGVGDAMTSDSTGAETDKLAPPPETPAPQALAQQAQAADNAKAQATQTPLSAPPSALSAAAAAQPAAAPLAALPPVNTPPVATAPKATAPTPPPPPPPSPAAPSPPTAQAAGHAEVQLAALDSEAAAHAEWDRLRHRYPALLAGHAPSITRFDHDGHSYWRLRTGGFTDIGAATQFCAGLRAKGAACDLARF